MKICTVAMMLVWLCGAAAVGAQPLAGGPPGSMRLLAGYQHERLRGMDTTVGTANFVVRGIRGDDEFAEVLLMLLSY